MSEETTLIPDTFPMGDDGPSQSDIEEMKKVHGPLKGCYVAEKRYVIRMMTRDEYLDFQKEVNDRMTAGDLEFDVRKPLFVPTFFKSKNVQLILMKQIHLRTLQLFQKKVKKDM